MRQFCLDCGKPATKAGKCAACYQKDLRAKYKEEATVERLGTFSDGFENLLSSKLIPIFNTDTDQKITDWTEQNIFLPDGEGFFSVSHPDWSMAPEMEFIFEQLKNPDVKEIYLQFGSQSSKTLFQICAMSWFIAERKVNGLFVPPDERLIKRLQVRMHNIWEKSPIVNFEPKKGGKEFSSFGTNRIAWGLATSPSSLAEMPADFVDFDEIDEIKEQDINPIQLARSRGRTKPNFKLILASTPKKLSGNGGIQDYYNNSKRYAIEMQCPHCGEWSEFLEEHIQAEEGADYRSIEAKGLGYAICPSNGCEITDEHHEKMVMTQRWKDQDPELPMTYIGFHKASWNTIHNDFSSIAAKRLKSKEEGTNSFKDFYNSECARPIDLESMGGDLEYQELTCDYKRKQIPADVKAITVGVDLGKNLASCVVTGWAKNNIKYKIYEQEIAWDDRDWDKVERGVLHLLDDIRTEFVYLGDGPRPMFTGGAFDAGYRSNLVYDFCRRYPLWVPIMGQEPLSKPILIKPADPQKKYGKQSKGVNLYNLKAYYWQDVFQTALEKAAGTEGSWNIPTDYTDRYVNQLNNEVKRLVTDNKGFQKEIWTKKYKGAKNDYRDASIYSMVRGYTLDLDKMRDKPTLEKRKSNIPKYKNNTANRRQQFNRR